MLKEINYYFSILIMVVVVSYIIFRLTIGFLQKTGKQNIVDKYYIWKEKKKFDRDKFYDHYLNREISIYELENIAKEDMSEKKAKNFSLKVKIDDTYDEMYTCVFALEQKENDTYIVKDIVIYDKFNNWRK